MTRTLLLCAAVLAAGCIGGDEPVDPAGGKPTPPTTGVEPNLPPEPTAPGPNVTAFNGSIAGAGNPASGYVRASGDNLFAFDLPEGATGLVVEVAWVGGDALDVQLDVPADHCEPVDPAGLLAECPSPAPDQDGVSPARIEVLEPDALARVGEWRLGAWARASANEVPFTAYVTVFREGKPPASYTAVPAG